MAVVQVLQTGKMRDPFLGACARSIWMEAAKADIDIVYSHIRGSKNVVADLLSGGKIHNFNTTSSVKMSKIQSGCLFPRISYKLIMKCNIITNATFCFRPECANSSSQEQLPG